MIYKMGCSKSKTSDSSILEIDRKFTKIYKVSDVRIDATSFISAGKGSLFDNYTMQETISNSLFGMVRKATHLSTSQVRAVKSFKKSFLIQGATNINKFFHEILVLKKTDHPNIVKIYEFYEDAKYYHLVTEYIAGGELFNYIISHNALTESTAAHFIRQLLSAVAYCHTKKIVHRDLKPENLLMDSQSPDAILKIIDFGMSTILDSHLQKPQKFGSALYVAPEVFDKVYNEKCDIWSCGVILYILLCGKPPFNGKTDKEIFGKVRNGRVAFIGKKWENISENAKKLIGRMIEINQDARISASEAIQDEWIRENTDVGGVKLGDISLLNNLQAFHVNRKMQNAVLAFISAQVQVKEKAKELIDIFRVIDINGDGRISEQELIEAFTVKLGRQEALEQARIIMKEVDTNNSGHIDYSEFLVASSKLEDLLNVKYLTAAFKAFDRDGNGKINAKELNEVLGKNFIADEEVWQEMIDQVDENNDGQLDFNEFATMMKKLNERS